MAIPQRMAVSASPRLPFANGHQFPDSPVIIDSFASPELRGEASSSDLNTQLSAFRPTYSEQPSAEAIVQLLQVEERDDSSPRAALILRHALQWAVERCDVDLIVWLAGLTGRWASVLDSEVSNMENEEGWGLVGMAVQASCGRQDKEEIVRVVVGRWGVGCGPRAGRDRTGWTPLHLAVLISTPPLISFMLTRGASPGDSTNRGLTPLDLVAGIPDRQHISSLLQQASNQGTSTLGPTRTNLTEGRQRLLRRRRHKVERESARGEDRAWRERRDAERERWVRERVEVVGVDPNVLFAKANEGGAIRDSGVDMGGDSDSEDENSPGIASETQEELAFSPDGLPTIFDTILTSYQPVCQPVSRRALPANMLYLYARFAYKQCSESWLEELLEGAVDRIEGDVYKNLEDLSYLAFWAYNTTLLLYLLVADDELRIACDDLGLLGMVEELINAIHVFVIRVAERRIDQVLDGAILDYETLEDFDDVRFEGEWALFRTFGTKKQRAAIIPKASQVFSDAVSAATTATSESGSPASLFNSLRGKSPFKQPPQSPKRPDTSMLPPPHPSSPALGHTPVESPSSVTDILTGVLVVLHIYDVNPIITVQAFSQVFFWLAAELFNRILSRKKYLCRSKAIQIRMNITALDDWVRLHGLPAKTADQHLQPVLQLLQWLQTQSSISAFDDLIGTVQGLKRLNPLQMRRAVREYKFEVNEGRMDEECVVYMGQIQKDWEDRRIRSSVQAAKTEQKGVDREAGIPGTPIDALLDGSTTLTDFIPSSGPESFGELLDSRFMLPFQLPDDPGYLIAAPTPDAVYTNFSASSPFLSDSENGSRTSFSSSRPFEFVIPPRKKLLELPRDFFSWLKAQEMGRRASVAARKSSVLRASIAEGGEPAVLPRPVPPPPRPARRTTAESVPRSLAEAVPSTASAPISTPTLAASPLITSSIASPDAEMSSPSDQFHEQAPIPSRHFETPSSPPSSFRPNPIELRLRQAVNSIHIEESQRPVDNRRQSNESNPPSSREIKHRPSMDYMRKITSPTRLTIPLPSSRLSRDYSGAGNPPATPSSPESMRPLPSLPTMSPASMTPSTSSDSGKKKWWKMGRKEGSGESDGSEGGKMRRKASTSTLGKGTLSPGTPDGKRQGFF